MVTALQARPHFSGVIPPVVIPRAADRSFDASGYRRHVGRLLAAGVHGLFVLGSSGEGAFATRALRQEILEATGQALAEAGQCVPVLAGVIDTQTERVIEQIRDAEAAGVDAVVATAPFYALGSPATTERHFRLLREATNLPIFAYDIPVCVGSKLVGEMLLRLGQEGVIAGVKDSSGDDVSFRWLCQANAAAGQPLRLLTGHEVVVDGAYLSGAHGAVPGLANVDPAAYVRQWAAYQARDWEQVRAEQDHLAELMRIVAVTRGVSGFGAGIGAFKTALMLLGQFESNQMPAPYEALTGENVAAVRGVLESTGLLPR